MRTTPRVGHPVGGRERRESRDHGDRLVDAIAVVEACAPRLPYARRAAPCGQFLRARSRPPGGKSPPRPNGRVAQDSAFVVSACASTSGRLERFGDLERELERARPRAPISPVARYARARPAASAAKSASGSSADRTARHPPSGPQHRPPGAGRGEEDVAETGGHPCGRMEAAAFGLEQGDRPLERRLRLVEARTLRGPTPPGMLEQLGARERLVGEPGRIPKYRSASSFAASDAARSAATVRRSRAIALMSAGVGARPVRRGMPPGSGRRRPRRPRGRRVPSSPRGTRRRQDGAPSALLRDSVSYATR